ncbi:MAG: F0F1 ATP synthase subunit A [Alphaproteobacteria bacterium]|nr:F0F1 ATP synthase subunit A [Alphaproteobacteria bacterium]
MSAAEHSPIAQFEVKPLYELAPFYGHDISFTNASLFMVLTVVTVWLFYTLAMRKRAMVPGRLQGLAEVTFQFVDGIVVENIGHGSRKYFPYIFSVFMFVLAANLLGMIPFSFTVTSHIIVTFALGALVFLSVFLVGIVKQGPVKFFAHFIPEGLPMWIIPVVFLIELVSFLSRPCSLAIRLAANMMAGHTLLKVIAGFIVPLGIFGIAPMVFLVLLTSFEVFIAILQAYIFTLLSCMYLGEAVHEEAH